MRSNRRYYRNYQYGKKRVLPFKKIVLFILFVWLLLALVDHILITSYKTTSTSMEPSINLGAHFLATPLAYGAPIPFLNKNIPPLRTPGRGDLIVLQPSGISEDPRFINWIDEIVGFFTLNKISIDSTRSRPWENREVVKRIIAIPGDTVRMTNFRVEIKIPENGGFRSENQVLENFEPIYPDFPPGWDGTHPFSGNLEVLTLGKDEYFVLSDNRGVGLGSTYLGPIKRDEIKKFVILKYLPWPLEILK